MENTEGKDNYIITTCHWEDVSIITKQKMQELLKIDFDSATEFCRLYFNKFDIVHKIGHVIIKLFHNESRDDKEAEDEYLANLFTLKYFQFKNDKKYLFALSNYMSEILAIYNTKLNYDALKLNVIFDKYKQDVRTYGALHFLSFLKCFEERANLKDVLETISNGYIKSINNGIILRNEITGMELLNECLSLVFDLNNAQPDVKLKYIIDFDIQKLGKLDE